VKLPPNDKPLLLLELYTCLVVSKYVSQKDENKLQITGTISTPASMVMTNIGDMEHCASQKMW